MTSFDDYCRRKEELASRAAIPGYTTVTDRSSDFPLQSVGNDWTTRLFDGWFHLTPPAGDVPAVSLVFVQSREGNTGADNPSTLGGGDTDTHLVYEGLSRVAADAVMAGATTARSERMVFSVWHPELVRLRRDLGHSRHPAQVVITGRGDLAIERSLMFQVPELRVYIITGSSVAPGLRERVRERPWIEVLDAGSPISLTSSMRQLCQRGIHVISAVGGRRTATALLKEGLVRDLYLTTSPISAGEPNTPFYEGPLLPLTQVLEKAGKDPEAGVRFEHLIVEATKDTKD